jgi:protein-S-isoprenylcysteine O-methyltransferase Ste14
VLISAGFGLLGWAITSFRRAGTNVPTNRPALALVVTGPYRFSRNPIYVGGTLAYLGLALAVDGVWLAALLAPFLLILRYGVIAREERYLEAKFGAAYRAYTQNVRRWL